MYFRVNNHRKKKKTSKDELMIGLIELEQKHMDMYQNKYNINPVAGKTRLGSKHSLETKALFSSMRKENPSFLGKTHSEYYKDKLRARMSGSNNLMFGRPVTEQNKKLITETMSKKNLCLQC